MSIPKYLPCTDDQKDHLQKDKKLSEIVTSTTESVNGHYQLSLPFRNHNQNVRLSDNSKQALQRLQSLSNMMTKHLNFQEDNKTSMLSILDNGYAEIVPSVEPSRYDCMPTNFAYFVMLLLFIEVELYLNSRASKLRPHRRLSWDFAEV